jgi:WXG100 family type VII secretion target
MINDEGTITYDYIQCEQVWEDLGKDQGTIGGQIAALEGIITGLMSTWTGLSADQWQTIQRQWMTAIDNMTVDLQTAASALTEMTAAMQHADRASAIRIGSIGSIGQP